jgi:Domain of unknown function (DUF6531)
MLMAKLLAIASFSLLLTVEVYSQDADDGDEYPIEDSSSVAKNSAGQKVYSGDQDSRGPTAQDSSGNVMYWDDERQEYYYVAKYFSVVRAPVVPGGRPLPDTIARNTNQTQRSTDPVMGSGEFVIETTDLTLPGFGVQFEFRRIYRSSVRYQGVLGYGWVHNYQRRIIDKCALGTADCSGDVYYQSGRLERIRFQLNGVDPTGSRRVYTAGSDFPLRLERHLDAEEGHWVLDDGTGIKYLFDRAHGALHQVRGPAGDTLQINWDHNVQTVEGGVITSVQDTTGRIIYYNHKIYPREIQDASARLECISLTPDCARPLLKFETSSTGEYGEEFDLERVLDANGHGPTYVYHTEAPSDDGASDGQLIAACHSFCDLRTEDVGTCHNFDACERKVQDILDFRCGFDRPSMTPILFHPEPLVCNQPGVPCYPNSAQTRHGKLLPWLDQAPFRVDLNTGQISFDARYPGAAYCIMQCLRHPGDADACYTDKYPDCQDLADTKSGPFSDELWPFLVYRHACHCMQAYNETYCSFHPYTIGCKGLLKESADVGIVGDQMEGYAKACRAELTPILHAANKDCPAKCYSQCTLGSGSHDTTGKRKYAFGRRDQLDHTLIEIWNGDGHLVLRNTYGMDRFDIGFARVVAQQITETGPDNIVRFDYHDLVLEQKLLDGALPVLPGTPQHELSAAGISLESSTQISEPFAKQQYQLAVDSKHVTPLSAFDPVEVCPTQCTRRVPVRIPPNPGATGLVPIHLLNPLDQKFVRAGAPLLLRRRADGLVEIESSARKVSRRAVAKAFAHVSTPRGDVAFSYDSASGVVRINGLPGSIDTLFGQGNHITLQLGIGGMTFATPGARRKNDRVEFVSSKVNVNSVSASVSQDTGVKGGIANHPEPIKNLNRLSDAGTLAKVDNASFIGYLVASGHTAGVGPIVVVRTDTHIGEIGRASRKGLVVAHLTTPTVSVRLLATEHQGLFKLADDAKDLFDSHGRAQLVIERNGDILAVPAESVLKSASKIWEDIGRPFDIPQFSEPGPGICVRWETGGAVTHPGPASGSQIPQFAVVIHDLHGVVRTNYYDNQWRVVREVNHSAQEVLNRNYKRAAMHCVGFPSGDRVIQETDNFSRPLQVTQTPAPSYAGGAEPQITTFLYDLNGQLTDVLLNPDTPSEGWTRFVRDQWSRIKGVDLLVEPHKSQHIAIDYPGTPEVNPTFVMPSSVTSPSGIITRLRLYDPSGGGPTLLTANDNTAHAITTEFRYDQLGRLHGQGRRNHPGSETSQSFDAAGFVNLLRHADLQSLGKWVDTQVSHNASGQAVRISDDKTLRCMRYDPLNQPILTIEHPRDGKTASKSTCYRYSPDGRLDYAVFSRRIRDYLGLRRRGTLGSRTAGISELCRLVDECLRRLPSCPPNQCTKSVA